VPDAQHELGLTRPTDRPELSWQEVPDAQHELGLTRPTDRPDLSWQEVPDSQHELGLRGSEVVSMTCTCKPPSWAPCAHPGHSAPHVLAGARKRLRAGGGQLRLAAASGNVARVLHATGLDEVLPLYLDVAGALEL